MKKVVLSLFSAIAFMAFATSSTAQCNASKAQVKQVAIEDDIVDIALGSKDHTTLVAAVKAAGLVETLKSEGPFTVFAPTNDAFAKLPEGTVETLLKPENKGQLTSILTYHVVPGNLDANAVVAAIKSGNGTASVKTVSGGTLKAMIVDGNVMLKDENGNTSKVIATDLKGSNGVIHVIDSVVLPKS
ncbi:MAG: fasciclin domain-containing protein [Saprospiraceae bacterium]|nr:fasciclin domain-containing protein [Saprospiraceae bacterium]